MRGAARNAALAYRDSHRRPFGPGRQTRSVDATSGQSPIAPLADRAKDTAKIAIVPFVPAQSAFCRRAELVLLGGVPAAALVAALAALLQAVTR